MIKQIIIYIEPAIDFNKYTNDLNRVHLRGKIKVTGKPEYAFQHMADFPVFESLFDIIWRDLGKRIKKDCLKKENGG